MAKKEKWVDFPEWERNLSAGDKKYLNSLLNDDYNLKQARTMIRIRAKYGQETVNEIEDQRKPLIFQSTLYSEFGKEIKKDVVGKLNYGKNISIALGLGLIGVVGLVIYIKGK